MAKMSMKKDRALDKKAGIKEGSKRDIALDKRRGVPDRDYKQKQNFGKKGASRGR